MHANEQIGENDRGKRGRHDLKRKSARQDRRTVKVRLARDPENVPSTARRCYRGWSD